MKGGSAEFNLEEREVYLEEKEMKVWNFVNKKKSETFSWLPPLTDSQIAKQVDMIMSEGLSSCLKFAPPDHQQLVVVSDRVVIGRRMCARFSLHDREVFLYVPAVSLVSLGVVPSDFHLFPQVASQGLSFASLGVVPHTEH